MSMETWHAEEKGMDNSTCMDVSTTDLNTSSQTVYYGVNILNGNFSNTNHGYPLVFSEKMEALQAARKYMGARFKAFSCKDDAILFAKQNHPTPATPDKCLSPTKCTNLSFNPTCAENAFDSVMSLEKSSPYKSVKSQESVKFRKAIEKGDSDFFTKAVWSNPRYLISSGDTPSVLQEGSRYNSLHVAARSKQPYLTRLILSTIEDDKFLRLLFCDDPEDIFNQRKAFIVDLYLNMPDKGLCETPLHFACKFGCLKVVEVLLAHPICDRTRVNKGGKTARESICDRSGDAATKRDIQMLFEAQYVIPVLRSEGNSIQPIIGRPFSLDDPSTAIKNKELPDVKNPLLVIKAKAGPMPLNKVNEFYKKWKSSGMQGSPMSTKYSSSGSILDNSIRFKDSDKGLERIGRQLAKEFVVPWTEYWLFLNAWCDISSADGLGLLENYLKEVRQLKMNEMQATNNMSKISSSRFSLLDSSLSPMSVLCRQLEKFHLNTPQSQSDNHFLNATPANSNSTPNQSPYTSFYSKKNIASKLIFDNDSGTGIKRKFSEFDLSSSEKDVTRNNITFSCISSIGIVDALTTFLMDSVSFENEDSTNSFESLVTATGPAIESLSNSATNHNHLDVPNIHKCVALLVHSSLKENLNIYHLEKIGDICENLVLQEHDSSQEEFIIESGKVNENFGRRSLVAIKKTKSWIQEHLQCILNYLRYYLPNERNSKAHSCACSWRTVDNASRVKLDNVHDQNTSSDNEEYRNSDDSNSGEEFITPPTSRSSSPMETPEDIMDIFIQGQVTVRNKASIWEFINIAQWL